MRRLLPVVSVSAVIVALAACNSTTDGHGTVPAPVVTGSGSGSGSSSPAGTQPPDLRAMWTTKVGGAPGSEQQLSSGSADTSRVYVSNVSGTVFALNAGTGKVTWQRQVGNRSGSGVGVVGSTLGYLDANDGAYFLSASTGSTLWRTANAAGDNGKVFTPVVSSGLVLAGTDGEVTARSLRTGKAAWTNNSDTRSVSLSYPASDASHFFAVITTAYNVRTAAETLVLASLSAKTGHQDWSTPLPSGLGSLDTVLTAGPGILVVTDHSTNPVSAVLAFDPATGRQLWKTSMRDLNGGDPTLLGGQVVFPTLKGVRALSAKDGHEIYTTPLDTGGSTDSAGRCGNYICAVGLHYVDVLDASGTIVGKADVEDDADELITSADGSRLYLVGSDAVTRYL